MPLDQVSFGEIVADPKYSTDEYFARSYRWLLRKIGFWPHFFAVGNDESVGLTGYDNQWRVYLGNDWSADGTTKRVYRRKGEAPNNVLLVYPFDALPSPVFSDYGNWHIVLNTDVDNEELSDRVCRLVLRPSWSATDWLRHASRNPCDIQMVVPSFDTRKACEVWVRNQATRRKLERMGFRNVIVKRLPVPKW